jgi:hypothetical protein
MNESHRNDFLVPDVCVRLKNDENFQHIVCTEKSLSHMAEIMVVNRLSGIVRIV